MESMSKLGSVNDCQNTNYSAQQGAGL